MVVMPGRGTDQAPPLPSLEQSFGPFAPLCLVASRFFPPSVGKATLLLEMALIRNYERCCCSFRDAHSLRRSSECCLCSTPIAGCLSVRAAHRSGRPIEVLLQDEPSTLL
jgi:hypothetical protein